MIIERDKAFFTPTPMLCQIKFDTETDPVTFRAHSGKSLSQKYCQWARPQHFLHITKTRLYKFDPLNPHFYIVKLEFTRYTLVFIFLLKNIDCGYSLEPPRRGGSNEYPQSMF